MSTYTKGDTRPIVTDLKTGERGKRVSWEDHNALLAELNIPKVAEYVTVARDGLSEKVVRFYESDDMSSRYRVTTFYAR